MDGERDGSYKSCRLLPFPRLELGLSPYSDTYRRRTVAQCRSENAPAVRHIQASATGTILRSRAARTRIIYRLVIGKLSHSVVSKKFEEYNASTMSKKVPIVDSATPAIFLLE